MRMLSLRLGVFVISEEMLDVSSEDGISALLSLFLSAAGRLLELSELVCKSFCDRQPLVSNRAVNTNTAKTFFIVTSFLFARQTQVGFLVHSKKYTAGLFPHRAAPLAATHRRKEPA